MIFPTGGTLRDRARSGLGGSSTPAPLNAGDGYRYADDMGPLDRNESSARSLERQDVDAANLKATVRRAAAGDEAAAGLLFDAYHPRIFRYALGKLANRADAEDVAAETFAKVLRELGRFRWKGAGFEAWLFRIASNAVVDHVRKAGREQADETVAERVDTAELRTPEAAVLEGETSEELRAVLAQLVPEQREVLLLRFAAGLDAAEAGRVMGKKPNAIRQLQFRALANVRGMITEETRR